MKYGFLEDEYSEEDHIFGAFLPKEVLVEDGDWTPYLPQRELQSRGWDTYGCVSFTVLNAIEILIKRKYDEDVNYADRFLAAVSGTSKGGNSPRKVCNFLRKVGVVPEDMYPFTDTFEEYYQGIPPKLYELAREFNEKWEFRYEEVPNSLLTEAIKYSPLLVSVPAWFKTKGLFYRPEGMKDNHATTLIKVTPEYKSVFDTYESNIKDIDPNMEHSSIKRFYIKKRTSNRTFKKTFWLWELIRRLIT